MSDGGLIDTLGFHIIYVCNLMAHGFLFFAITYILIAWALTLGAPIWAKFNRILSSLSTPMALSPATGLCGWHKCNYNGRLGLGGQKTYAKEFEWITHHISIISNQ